MKENRKNIFKFTEISLFFFIFIAYLLFSADFSNIIKLSFVCLSVFVLYSFLLQIISNRESLAFCVINIFYFCFYLIAPIIQLDKNDKFLLNTMPIVESDILQINIYLSLFIFIFASAYYCLSRHHHFQTTTTNLKYYHSQLLIKKKDVYILLAISICGFAFAFNFISTQFFNQLIALKMDQQIEVSSIYGLISAKVIGSLPVIGVLFALHYGRYNKGMIIVTIILLIILLVFKNPIMERRNALGPVYLTILVMLFPSFLGSLRKMYYLVLTILVLGFPLLSVFTHYSVDDLKNEGVFTVIYNELIGHFTNMHYDAWANGVGILDFVNHNGIQLGKQILAAFLFFVPRDIWVDKPNTTGMELGDYLMSSYNLWFNNISATFPMEGYVDFGVFGVVFYALGLALFIVLLEKKAVKSYLYFIFYIYFSFSCFFIFRGSFSIAYAYVFGAFIGLVLVPKIAKIKFFKKNR